MGSSLYVFSTVSRSLEEEGKKKCIFYTHPKSEEQHTWGVCHILLFLLSWDNDNLIFPRIPSAGVLAKDKERMEKYHDAGTLASFSKGETYEWGMPLKGVAWSWAEARGTSEGGGRQKEEGKPHLFKSYGTSLFCQRGNVWVSDNFIWTGLPWHYIYPTQDRLGIWKGLSQWRQKKDRKDAAFYSGEQGRKIPNSQGNFHSAPKHPEKNSGANLEQ